MTALPPPPIQPAPRGPVPGSGLAVASMVLGICSLALTYVGIFPAIVGLPLGLKAKRLLRDRGRGTAMATAGIVCSIIGLVLQTLLCIVVTFFIVIAIKEGAD